jgi:hypothetical protein
MRWPGARVDGIEITLMGALPRSLNATGEGSSVGPMGVPEPFHKTLDGRPRAT